MKAQDFPDLQFEHITVKDGLSSNSVTAIAQDHQGFIWVGTSNGLNRYDGYRFKTYFHSNSDSNSLVNNDVQRLYCDKKGRLWISTEDGVSCFIPAQNRFINFSTLHKRPHQLKNNSSVGVYEDAKGIIWLTNQMDVLYKVLSDLSLEELKINLPGFTFYNQYLLGYDKIFSDRAGNEWAARGNRLYKLNTITKQVESTVDCKGQIDGFILKLIEDSAGHYYISTYGSGIWQFTPGNPVLTEIKVNFPSRIFGDIREWKYKNRDWIVGLEGNFGLCLVNPANLSVAKYVFIASNPGSIQGNNFSQCFIDSNNNVWIASNRGINKINAEQNIFTVVPVTDPGFPNYDLHTSTAVYGFFEADSSVWLSKRGVSTIEYNLNFNIKNYYSRLYPLSTVPGIFNICGYAYSFYKKGNELFITTDSGLVVLDLLKKISTIFFPEKLPTSPDFRTIISRGESEIWIRSFSYGLFVFNTETKKFTKRYDRPEFCTGCAVIRSNYLFKSRKGEIFVTTGGIGMGLFKYDNVSDKFKPVKAVNDERFSMLGNDLFGMDEDKDGNLWITRKSGLFVYSPEKNKIIEQDNGNEPSGNFQRICFDNYGNAWANGNSGIWCYLASKKTWISFNGQDGLPGSLFDGVIAKRNDGDIIASLEGAVAIFHPDKLTERFTGPPVVVTEAAVDKRLFTFSLVVGVEKKLTLAAGQNSFSADFAILNYVNPAASRYYYKLSPLVKDFQLNDNGHINFNGLAPGHYTLHVKGGDKTGNIFDMEDVLEIYVTPAWYQTTLFKILGIFTLSGLIVYFVRRRITAIRNKAFLKQKMAETEMQALRAQMNPHFIFNSLNSIENFIMLNEKRLASDYLNKFSRLVRSILDSSRNELVPFSKDMEALDLYVELEQLRFNNKFRVEKNIDPSLLQGDYRVPSLLIQPFVENAIIHGIAHSEKEGLLLSVSARLSGDFIKYTIEDNGVGRKQSAQYNLKNKPGHKSVGLQITMDRINYFNRGAAMSEAVKFTDLYDATNQPAGTKAEVYIKLI